MGAPAGPQYLQIIDTTGPLVGATVEYTDLSDNAQAVYSDATLLTSLGGTLSGGNASDSKGRFPIHFLDPSLDYKRVIKTSAGATWRTDNPVQTANDDLADYVPKAGATMTGALFLKKAANIASASNVNLDTATGNYGTITGTTGINSFTFTQGIFFATFDGVLTITPGASLIVPGSTAFDTDDGGTAIMVANGSGVTKIVSYERANGKQLVESAEILIAVGDESTAITTGNAKITFRAPFAMTLDAIPRGSLTTASSSGHVAVDINVSGSSIFSTVLKIDENTVTSVASGTPAVLSTTSIADNAAITIDVDDDGTNATGLKVLLRGYRRN